MVVLSGVKRGQNKRLSWAGNLNNSAVLPILHTSRRDSVNGGSAYSSFGIGKKALKISNFQRQSYYVMKPNLMTDATASLLSNKPFTVVELEQGSTEWRRWRHSGIGGSDASVIMGENRFSSIEHLLREKQNNSMGTGPNAAMALGTELESEALRRYIEKTGRHMAPICLQSTRHEWLRASLDGMCISHNSIVEIKCGKKAYQIVCQTGAVPQYYYGQVQHILAVTGLDSLDFWCFWPGCRGLLVPVARNNAYIERLLEKELDFWNRLCAGSYQVSTLTCL